MKKAFSLSEVLMALTIVGIIAAITVPSIANNMQKEAWVAAFQKVFNELDQATEIIMQGNNGIMTNAWAGGDNNLLNLYIDKVKFTKICYSSAAGNCFHDGNSSWKALGGANGWINPTVLARAIMSNGAMIAVDDFTRVCTNGVMRNENNQTIGCGVITVDVNGFTGPNVTGRDIFTLVVTKNGLIPEGDGLYNSSEDICDTANSTGTTCGRGCASRIVQDGWKMNY